jgi:RHS repeat-associated protein
VSDPSPKVTTFTYTDRSERLREIKGNGNTVDYTYFLDGMLKTQTEKKPDGTLVSDNVTEYDLNGNRVHDVSKKMNADSHGAYLTSTVDRVYDPRDRLASATTTGDGAGSETYIHDANNNVTSQTVKGVSTTSVYDRNRLITATSSGSTSSYNYDTFGRLDTVTAAGQVVQRNVYDGFDHVVEHRQVNGGTTSISKYAFDPMDRTSQKITDAGTSSEKTTTFAYLGLSSEILNEESAGQITKAYQYSPWGERLSQTKTNDTGAKEDGYYGYNPHTDVEQLTDSSGNTKATYGYTAYGSNDAAQFTGVDKPDTADPTKEPYNAYRFNAKRWDQNSGTYDMGFRDYSPGLNQFLTRDSYNGALSDMKLCSDPWTGNRYAFGGGNPISAIELDGHKPAPEPDDDGGSLKLGEGYWKLPNCAYGTWIAAGQTACPSAGSEAAGIKMWLKDIIWAANEAGIDPRMLISILIIESHDDRSDDSTGAYWDRFLPDSFNGKNLKPSVGVANMQQGTFVETVNRHGTAFNIDPETKMPVGGHMGAEGLWRESVDDERLSIRVAAYRLRDLMDMQPKHEGRGTAYSTEQLAAVGYNIGPELMNQIADGSYPRRYHTMGAMGEAGESYLKGYNDWWQTANAWICTDKVLQC